MHKFKATDGHEYRIDMSIFDLKIVRDELSIDLGNLHEGNPPLLTKLDQNPVMLMDVIYVLVREQVSERRMDEIAWARTMGGAAAMLARDAFWKELTDFFRQFGRQNVAASIEKLLEIVGGYDQMGTEEIGTLSVADEVEQARAELRQRMAARRDSIFGGSYTSGQDTSESTPTNSPAGN